MTLTINLYTMRSKRIINTVCDYYGVKRRDVLTKRREQPCVLYRQVIQYFLSEYGYTTVKAGKLTGRDHSTVCHSKTLIPNLMWTTPEFAVEMHDISELLVRVDKAGPLQYLFGRMLGTFVV